MICKTSVLGIEKLSPTAKCVKLRDGRVASDCLQDALSQLMSAYGRQEGYFFLGGRDKLIHFLHNFLHFHPTCFCFMIHGLILKFILNLRSVISLPETCFLLPPVPVKVYNCVALEYVHGLLGEDLRTHNGQYVILVKVKMNVHTGETSYSVECVLQSLPCGNFFSQK